MDQAISTLSAQIQSAAADRSAFEAHLHSIFQLFGGQVRELQSDRGIGNKTPGRGGLDDRLDAAATARQAAAAGVEQHRPLARGREHSCDFGLRLVDQEA